MLHVKHLAQCFASNRYSAVNGVDWWTETVVTMSLAYFKPGPDSPVGFGVVGCYMHEGPSVPLPGRG